MRCSLPATLGLLAALAVAAPLARAQELPGTPSGALPAPLRDLYEERGIRPSPIPPPAGAPPGPALVPVRLERPWLILVPDIRISSGYSDNIFITPDVLGFETKSDGLVNFAPRLRALFRISRELGLVADYNLSYTQFFSNGNSVQNSGVLFLGYRPSVETHAEFGVRGGTASVSQFDDSNVNEGHAFVSGNVPLNEVASASAFASIGLREFPDRTRASTSGLVLGLGPIDIPVDPPTTNVDRGEDDVVANVGGALSVAYTTTGAFRVGYDYTNNNSDFSEIDYRSHRLSLAAVNSWWSWLSTQVAYSLTSRRFDHQLTADDRRERDDAIHDLTLTAYVAPPNWRLPYSRSVAVRIDYDLLASRSNVEGGKFDRNFFSVGLEVGLLPVTNLHFRKWFGMGAPADAPRPLGTP